MPAKIDRLTGSRCSFSKIVHYALAPALLLVAGCAGPAVRKSPALEGRQGPAGSSLSQWNDLTPSTDALLPRPSAGEDCAIVYDPRAHRLVIFGGKTDADVNVNEVWSLDLESYRWQQITTTGPQPDPSEDHASLYDPVGHRMLIHGGEDGPTRSTLWSLDLSTAVWSDLSDTTSPRREDHTAIFDSRRKRMVIFGGIEPQWANIWDTWGFGLDPARPDFERWIDLTNEEQHPPGRMDHVAVYDSTRDRMIVYGGWDILRGQYFGDTWQMTFADGHWQQIKTKKSSPPRRRHAVGVHDKSRDWFIVYGGYGEEGYLNDVWAFDLENDIWLNITPGPQPRMDHQAVFNPRSGRLLIYGGDARLRGKFHDLWELGIHPGIPLEQLRRAATK